MISFPSITHIFQLPLAWLRAVHARCFNSFPGDGINIREDRDGGLEFSADMNYLAAKEHTHAASDLSGVVTLTGTQTVTGAKTFTNALGFTQLLMTNGDGTTWGIRGTGATSSGFNILHGNDYNHPVFKAGTDGTAIFIGNGINTATVQIFGESNGVTLYVAPTDTTSTSSKALATLGWVNQHFLRPNASATGFVYNSNGTISHKSFGTTSGTVAEGNHTHDYSNTYAAKSHTHTTSQITGLGDAATLNVGTTSGTVAAGNHTHDYSGTYAAKSHTHTASEISGLPAGISLGPSGGNNGTATTAARSDHTHDVGTMKCTIDGHSGNCFLVVDTNGNITHSTNEKYNNLVALSDAHQSGAYTFQDRNSSPTDTFKTAIYRGAVLLYRDKPRLEFHFNNASSYTSEIYEYASGQLEIISPNHAFLSVHPSDTTDLKTATTVAARQIATCGWVNSALVPAAESANTTLNPDSDAANSSTWTAGGTNGAVLKKLYRSKYVKSSSGSPILYAYYRNETYDAKGRLVSVSGETRETIDTTTLITWA